MVPRYSQSLAIDTFPDEIVKIITGRNEVVAKVIFLQACVCPQGGGVSASVHAGIPPPLGADPPGADTPLGADPPGADTPRADTPHPWSKYTPLGLSTSPGTKYTPPGLSTHPPQTLACGQRVAGTHPTGMHSCFLLLPVGRYEGITFDT